MQRASVPWTRATSDQSHASKHYDPETGPLGVVLVLNTVHVGHTRNIAKPHKPQPICIGNTDPEDPS